MFDFRSSTKSYMELTIESCSSAKPKFDGKRFG